MNELEKNIKGCFDQDLSFVRFDDVRVYFTEMIKLVNQNALFWQEHGMSYAFY